MYCAGYVIFSEIMYLIKYHTIIVNFALINVSDIISLSYPYKKYFKFMDIKMFDSSSTESMKSFRNLILTIATEISSMRKIVKTVV